MAVAEKIHTLPKAKQSVPANVVKITPKMAEDLLGKNVKNRRISKSLVDAYARDMQAGNWRFTGEAIKLSISGKLLDGQHRLLACIKAEAPFTSLMVYDLEDDAQQIMDTGRTRTVADALTINGHSLASRVASACRWTLMVKNGYSRTKVTHSEQLGIFNKHPGLNESAHIVQNAYGISPGLLTCLHYICANLVDNKPFADEFVTIFITGNSFDGCAAHAWRERLIKMKAGKTPITHGVMFNGSIHAWNLFAKSQTVKFIRVPDSVEIEGLDTDLI